MFKKVHLRILFLISSAALIILSLFILLFKIDTNYKAILFKEKSRQEKRHLEEILKLLSSTLHAYAYDYSYWDEMVDFVRLKDPDWANANIHEGLAIYKANVAWVLDTNMNQIYSTDNKQGAIGNYCWDEKVLEGILRKNAFNEFFIVHNNDLIEVQTAPIQPSADNERITEPQGYFIVGRLWDVDCIENVRKITNSDIKIVLGDAPFRDTYNPSKHKDITHIEFEFFDWDNRVAGRLISHSDDPYIVYTREYSKYLLTVLIIGTIVVVGMIFGLLYFWVAKPLKKISSSLELEMAEDLGGLSKNSTEFGRIAKLISESFRQKELLISEVEERQRMEKSLEEKLKFIQAIIDAVASPIYYKGKNGCFVGCNKAFEDMVGKSRENIIGKKLCDIFPVEAAEYFQERDLELLNNGEAAPEEVQIKIDERRTFDLIFYRAIYSEDDDPRAGIVGTTIDITQRKIIENELRESEEKFRRIIETSPVIIWSEIPNPRQFLVLSPSIENLTGHAASEHISNPHLESSLIIAEDLEKWRNHYSILLETGKPQSFEIKIKHKTGDVKISSIFITPGFDEKGIVERIDGVAIDITDKRNLENQVIQSEKMAAIGLLAAGVAHEFNNLLCGISGNISLAQENLGERDLLNTCLKEAMTASERAEQIVRSLLSYSRNNSDEKAEVDIAELIGEILNLTSKEFKRQNIRFYSDYCNVPKIRANPGRLQQVFLNILINAIHAVRDDGIISISAWSDRGFVFVEFSDNGVGIKGEIMDKIFDPFFTEKNKWTHKKITGSGLGLSICQNIIKGLGGEIHVLSEPDIGTEFVVVLPVSDPVQMTFGSSKILNNCRILLLEFDDQDGEQAINIIRNLGGDCRRCRWSNEGIALLMNEKFDSVILDANHPGMVGFVELHDHIKINHPDMPVFISSRGPIKYQFDEYAATSDGVIYKPYSSDLVTEAFLNLKSSLQNVRK